MSMKRRRSNASDERPRDPPRVQSIVSGRCVTCSTMEWSLLAEKSKTNQPVDDFNEAVTKSHEQLRLSYCGVCQLLSLLKTPDLDNLPCNLKAISLYRRFTGRTTPPYPLQPNPLILSVVSKGSKPLDERRQLGHAIAFEPSPQASSFVDLGHFDHENVNFGLMRKWMDDCVDKHRMCERGTRSLIHTLQVIDCKESEDFIKEQPKIVDLPKDGQYAALSYVWGNVDHEFPQVVRDSITVALELKCGYLWVDRHCIPQDNENPKKKQQLKIMDEIYSQAKFTIVAAAGQDCNYGLVGISHPRKPDLRYAHIPGAKLTYLGTPPGEKIRSTLWASRGWTYQEGLLSHRRIFFTDEQVMFQCNTMTCLESFQIPKSVLNQPKKSKRRKDPFLEDIDPISLARKDIGKHLELFSTRNLTKDTDTLEAFSGVLSYFHKQEHCFHLHGSPIPTKKGKGHLINAWYHTEPATRNTTFPSWSWTGWKGEVKMTSRDHPDYDLRVFEPKSRDGHQDDEHSISLDDYIEACGKNPSREMRLYIEMKGKMTTMSFELIKWESEAVDRDILVRDGAWAILPYTTDTAYYSFLYLDEALTGLCQFKLPVMVLEPGIESPEHNIVILVLREMGDRFERAGMIILRRKKNKERAKLTLYRDQSGRWIQRTLLPHLQEFTWWKELGEQTIRLQ